MREIVDRTAAKGLRCTLSSTTLDPSEYQYQLEIFPAWVFLVLYIPGMITKD